MTAKLALNKKAWYSKYRENNRIISISIVTIEVVNLEDEEATHTEGFPDIFLT
jgi:hypothetical protein